VRVGLADDSGIFREGLELLLQAADIEVTCRAPDGATLLASIPVQRPDAIILDVRMPPNFTDEGLKLAEQISAQYPDIGILVLSTYAETSYAVRLMQASDGAVGYLLKDRVADVEQLVDALERVRKGEAVIDPKIVSQLFARQTATAMGALTPREREVLALMAEGRSNAGIGEILHLSARTVEAYVNGIFTKLEIVPGEAHNRRVLAVIRWLRG
jgi:DNA-binding NarL/FixJ family response regulator